MTDVVQSNSGNWSSEIDFVDYGSQNPSININGTKPVYCRIPASASQIDVSYKPSSGYFYLPYTTQGVNYGISARLYGYTTRGQGSLVTYLSTATTGSWTATGYAP